MTITAAITLVGAAGPVRAQGLDASDPPIDAAVQVGPLALSPAIRITNFGHDNNVNNRSTDDGPKGDFTATLSPVVDAWLRSPHVRVNGRSQFDFYYFKQLTDLRALDTDSAGRVELVLNRLTPFFEGTIANTRFRQNLEIDTIAKRRTDSVKPGANLRLTAKVSVGAYAERSRVQYEPNSLYLGTDLARELNHTSTVEGVAVRYALTPYTTFAVGTERQRDRFTFALDRNANSVRVGPSVEFNPNALVSGRAAVGFVRRTFLTGGVPKFNGTNAYVDLNYTLLGQTRFAVGARRELEYSYLADLRDYVVTEVDGSVTQRLGESWDVDGNLGRARLSYRQESTPTNLSITNFPDETGLTYGGDVGYRIGHTRIAFHFDHQVRQSVLPEKNRAYRRLRIGSTLTYSF